MSRSPSYLEERLLGVLTLLREHDPGLYKAIEPAIERMRETDLAPEDGKVHSPNLSTEHRWKTRSDIRDGMW